MKAFILISLDKAVRRTLKELQSYQQVKLAHLIFGEWDLILEMEIQNSEELSSFVMDKIRTREEVKLTSTLIVAGQ